MTPTLDSLLVACRADPADDLPRRIVAAWLEDNGQEARAELIQVQCELARMEDYVFSRVTGELKGPVPDPEVIRHAALRSREKELLEDYSGKWIRPLVKAFGMEGYHEACLYRRYATRDGNYEVDEIPYCFVRGLLHVEAPLGSLRVCLPQLKRELLWVGSVRASDRNPYLLQEDDYWQQVDAQTRRPPRFSWWKEDIRLLPDGSELPAEVFHRLANGENYTGSGYNWRVYPTSEAAFADLEQNGDLSGSILKKAWIAAQLPWPIRETTPTGG